MNAVERLLPSPLRLRGPPVHRTWHPSTSRMPSFLTRRVTFAAAHRYRIADVERRAQRGDVRRCARARTITATATSATSPSPARSIPSRDSSSISACSTRCSQREVRERFDHATSTSTCRSSPTAARCRQARTSRDSSASACRRRSAPRSRVTRVVVAEDSDAERDVRARLSQVTFGGARSCLRRRAERGHRARRRRRHSEHRAHSRFPPSDDRPQHARRAVCARAPRARRDRAECCSRSWTRSTRSRASAAGQVGYDALRVLRSCGDLDAALRPRARCVRGRGLHLERRSPRAARR